MFMLFGLFARIYIQHNTYYTGCFVKNNPFDFLLYICQIVDSYYKNYSICTSVLSSRVVLKTFGKNIIKIKGVMFYETRWTYSI